MQKNQLKLAFFLSLGIGTLGFIGAANAQNVPLKPNPTNLSPAEKSPTNQAMGIIESVSNTSMNVRLADGSIKSYPLNRQVIGLLKPIKGIAIILDKDIEVGVSRGGRPLQAFNSRIVDIKNNLLLQVRPQPRWR